MGKANQLQELLNLGQHIRQRWRRSSNNSRLIPVMLVVRMSSQIQLPVMIRIIIPEDQIAGGVHILVRVNITFKRGLRINKFTKMQGRAIVQD